jgi:hypothetical protein
MYVYMYRLNPVKVGRYCVVKSMSRVLSGAQMENRSILLEHSLVLSGEIVDFGSVWQGWPNASQTSLENYRDKLRHKVAYFSSLSPTSFSSDYLPVTTRSHRIADGDYAEKVQFLDISPFGSYQERYVAYIWTTVIYGLHRQSQRSFFNTSRYLPKDANFLLITGGGDAHVATVIVSKLRDIFKRNRVYFPVSVRDIYRYPKLVDFVNFVVSKRVERQSFLYDNRRDDDYDDGNHNLQGTSSSSSSPSSAVDEVQRVQRVNEREKRRPAIEETERSLHMTDIDVEYGHIHVSGGYGHDDISTRSSPGSPASGATVSDSLLAGDHTGSTANSSSNSSSSGNSGPTHESPVSHYHFSLIFIGQSIWLFILFSMYSFQMICPVALFLWSFITKRNSEFISYFVLPLSSTDLFPYIMQSEVLYGKTVVFYMPSLLAMATIFVWLIAVFAFNMLFVIALKWIVIGRYKTGLFHR